MKKIIEDLYPYNAGLLGADYDARLEYIKGVIPLDVQEFPTGTEVGNWYVPEEWIIRDAWVKHNGEKIIDFKDNPFAVSYGSTSIHKTVDLKELKEHLFISDEQTDAYTYDFKFYNKDWGFSMPKDKVQKKVFMKCVGGVCTPWLKDVDESVGQVMIDGSEIKQEYEELLQEGEYEVFIDAEHKPGVMKVATHTVQGKSDREVLLFAHLDHPYQANDNLSGVACLIDLIPQLQDRFEHTIKVVFCPETIGSIAYAHTNDISKVDFMIALDCVGNDNSVLIQKTFDKFDRVNYAVHLATAGQGIDYRKGEFRLIIGSDEYVFNDPKFGIPGLMLSRYPFNEYHTSNDTPDKISEEKIKEIQTIILKTIDIYEKDYIPTRHWTGPLMRSRYDMQTPYKLYNRDLDYLMYDIDGKKYLTELVIPLGIGFDSGWEVMKTLQDVGLITKVNEKLCRLDACEKCVKPTSSKKSTSVQRKAIVPSKPRKVSQDL